MKATVTTCFLLLTACAQSAPATVAIRGVTVVDVTDGSLHADRTVLIAGNRITAVGPAADLRVPDGADVIDAVGGFLIPGLWDAHVHSVGAVAVDTGVGPLTPAEWHLPLFLAHGVTGVRNMNDGTGDPTLERTNDVRRRLAEGDLHGPARFLANGPAVDGEPRLNTTAVVVRTPAQARAMVDTLVDHEADFIKVYTNLSRDAYFAILERARQRGVPVDGHIPFRVSPGEAAESGQRTVEHLMAMALGCSADVEAERERFDGILSDPGGSPLVERAPLALFEHEHRLYETRDPAACRETIEAYLRNGVAVAADLVAYHHVVHAREILADSASMRFVPAAVRRNWEEMAESDLGRTIRELLAPIVPLQAENARLLHEAGVPLLASTDVGIPTLIPGISLHDELALLVEAGLAPLEALRAATLNPARVFGLADSLGTIEAGKLADLVLLDANPLEDIDNTRRIRAVVADGRVHRRADLDRLLAEVEAQSREGGPRE